MPIYREASAEIRRLHRTADWRLAGVVVNGMWSPVRRGVEPPPARLIEAGLVSLAPLPTILAPDDGAAVRVALGLAAARWRPVTTARRRRCLSSEQATP